MTKSGHSHKGGSNTVKTRNLDAASCIVICEADLLANAASIDGDILSITDVHAIEGKIKNNHNGTWSFTPPDDFNGTIKLNFIVSDGHANVTQTAQIEVNPAHDAPIFATIGMEMTDDGWLIMSEDQLIRNASEVDGDNLRIAAMSSQFGSLINNYDGTWSFLPPANFNNELNLQFIVTDGQNSVPQNVIIDVQPVNDAPIVPEVNFNVQEDSTFIINEYDLLLHASDIDSDDLTVTDISSQVGSLINNGDGTWSFTTPTNFDGDLDLKFTVSDGSVTVAQFLNINVLPVNDTPSARNLTYVMNEDKSFVINAAQLLFDSGASDVDSDSISIKTIYGSGNIYGSLNDNDDGTWTYTPTQHYTGSANFNFVITDGSVSVTNTLCIIINPVNEAPIAVQPDSER